MEKLLLGIILPLFAFGIEFSIDSYRTKVLNRTDNHFITATLWTFIAFACSFANPTVLPWQTFLLCFSVRFAFFNALFNHYILGVSVWYLGNNLWDRIEKKITYAEARFFMRVVALATAIKFYIDPSIY